MPFVVFINICSYCFMTLKVLAKNKSNEVFELFCKKFLEKKKLNFFSFFEKICHFIEKKFYFFTFFEKICHFIEKK